MDNNSNCQSDRGLTGYPLKFHFQIPCVFPARPQIFPVPIYMICDYRCITDTKLTWQTLKKMEFSRQISRYLLPLESGKLQLGKNKFPVFFLSFAHFYNRKKWPRFSTNIFQRKTGDFVEKLGGLHCRKTANREIPKQIGRYGVSA